MRVLVIGNGGREHALLFKLRQSPLVSELFAAPGNAGMKGLAICVPPDGGDHGRPGRQSADAASYADLAEAYQIDLTVVGPEHLLVEGLVDEFESRGLRVFGPTRAAAMLEGSKVWAKDVMQRVGIPTASWRDFTDRADARARAADLSWRCVIKADGLAAGKGSFVCTTEGRVDEVLDVFFADHRFDGPVIVEELLDGQEVSVFAISDGRTVVPFGAAQDHKRLGDRDEGPNTGGMGAYSPVEHMRLAQDFAGSFFEPIVAELAARGTPYTGVLYAGAIVTPQGPKILEFNCRLGDPEAQVLLPRLKSDLAELLWHAAERSLHTLPALVWSQEEALSVVLAAGEYPDARSFGVPITGVGDAEHVDGVLVFHAGTDDDPIDGHLVTSGGRILSVTGLGGTLAEARSRAYEAVERIHFDGMQYRHDIGTKAIGTVWRSEWRKPPRWERDVVESTHAIGAVASALGRLQGVNFWTPREAEELASLRNRLYDVVARLNVASTGTSVSSSPPSKLSRLSSEFDALLAAMQRPGNMEGIDSVFRRTHAGRVANEATRRHGE